MANAGNSDDETNDALQSHKGSRIGTYTLALKLNVVDYAKSKSSIKAASDKFKIDRKRIREWMNKEDEIRLKLNSSKKKDKRKRLDGAGRKLLSKSLEEQTLDWIHERRSRRLRVSRKMIKKKATVIYRQLTEEGLTDGDQFVASEGWLVRFMKRNDLSNRRRTSVAQKDPTKLVEKIANYLLYTRRLVLKHGYSPADILAMDETPVWMDMVSNTTVDDKGAKEVTLRSTGHEKMRVSVCLAAKADGTKLKPMIVFKDAKRDVKALNIEFGSRCYVVSTANAWMNTATTCEWVRKVVGKFSFRRRLLAWDTYEPHMVDEVRGILKESKVDDSLIPGGATRYIQG